MHKASIPTRKEESRQALSLRDLAAPLFRRSKLLLLSFALTFGVMLVTGIVLPPSFKSQMSVLVNRERLDSPVTTENTTEMITASNPVTEEEINSEAELLKSRDVLEQVVLANGLADHTSWLDYLLHPRDTRDDRLYRAVQRMAKKLKIAIGLKTDVINVSYSSSDPRLSYGVLKTLGDLYVAKHVAVHHAPGSFVFFDDETRQYENALRSSEARLSAFGQQQNIAAPEVVQTDLALQLTNAIGQLHSGQEAMAADQQRIKADAKQLASIPERTATQQSSAPPDKLLADLNTALLAAKQKQSELALKYDANYPLVREANDEVAAARAAVDEAQRTRYLTETTDRDPTYELLREDLAKARTDLDSQKASVAATEASIQSMRSQMVDLDSKDLEERDLRREVRANEDNYLLYLSKREQARTSDALDKSRIGNVAIAIPPSIPALPTYSLPLITALALVLALFLSVSITYTADFLDPSFHTPSQVAEVLEIPVVVSMAKKTA